MKGVRYHVGGARGRSVVVGTKLEVADSGVLAISSKRTVFLGAKSTSDMPHAKLVKLNVFDDGVALNLSHRKTVPLFRIENGHLVAALINGAVQRL